jgi:hypothetical protein
MAASVLIKDIVDALEMQFEESASYLDLDSGQVETVSREILREAEESDDDEEPDLLDWQEDEWAVAKLIVENPKRFERLPSQFDIHEWEIMREFTDTVKSSKIREELRDKIHGRGAFRAFKDALRRHRIEQDWYTFRDEALRRIAIEWCEEIGVEWK